MATRSATEFRTGANTSGAPEEMPDWAKSLVHNIEEFRRTQDETKGQIEFLMTQLLDLKTIRPIEGPNHTTTPPAKTSLHRAADIREEPHLDVAKQGAKLEVTVFDGSLDPKKYMDWEVGLQEYFEWFQLPENR